MTGNEYQRLAGRTMNPELDGESTTRHALYGLASEVGEVMSIFQHALQEGEPISLPLVINEMGDVLWFASELLTSLDIPLDFVMQRNITKLLERYPEGFDAGRSMRRHEGDNDV